MPLVPHGFTEPDTPTHSEYNDELHLKLENPLSVHLMFREEVDLPTSHEEVGNFLLSSLIGKCLNAYLSTNYVGTYTFIIFIKL